jgi:hypothetical protein
MGGTSTSTQSTTTTSYVDSFNRTYDQVLNLSNVGNVALNIGAPPPAATDWTTLGVLALLAVGGWAILGKS